MSHWVVTDNICNMQDSFVQITVTSPTRSLANEIARLVVARQVAACAQVSGPVLSVYRWKNSSEEAEEWKIEIKTRALLFDEVRDAIMLIHTYEVPEIIACPLINITDEYADWINKVTKKPQ